MSMLFRVVLYLLCIIFALLVGYRTSLFIYELLDFQITLYSYFVELQKTLGSVSDTGSEYIQQFKELLGGESTGKYITQKPLYDRKIENFASKLLLISRVVGGVVGLGTYYIASSIIFGIRTHLQKVYQFIQ